MRAGILAQQQEQQERAAAEGQKRAQDNARFRRILSLADQQADDEAACQAFLTRQVQAENAAQMERHSVAKIEQAERRRAEEQVLVARMQADPMLSEVNDCVNHETGRRIPDRFRGFSTAQRHALREENKGVVQEKVAREQREVEDAREWGQRQARWNKLMEQQEAEERQARAVLQQQTKALLQLQKEEQKARKASSRADAFGGIEEGEGLFGKFGKSLA